VILDGSGLLDYAALLVTGGLQAACEQCGTVVLGAKRQANNAQAAMAPL
jgi:hypothetical protein